MTESFEHKEFGAPLDVRAMIEQAKAHVVSTGAADSEFRDLDNIYGRFAAGKITAKEAQEEVDGLLAARQDYH